MKAASSKPKLTELTRMVWRKYIEEMDRPSPRFEVRVDL